MTVQQIEFLIGLFFFVESLPLVIFTRNDKVAAVRLLLAIILIVLALYFVFPVAR